MTALYVVSYHYFSYVLANPRPSGVVGTVLLHGYMAVDLFFVLSGFVMAMTYGAALGQGRAPGAYAGFIVKRLGRVYPLFLVVTIVKLALLGAGLIDQPMPTGGTVLANVLMIQCWGLSDSIVATTWSISTEFAAYLLFPALVACVLTGPWRRAASMATIGAAVLVLVATRGSDALHQVSGGLEGRNGPLDVYSGTTPYPLLRCMAGFTLGMLAFRLAQVPAVRRLAEWCACGDAATLAVLALLAVPDGDVAWVLACVPLVIALAMGRSLAARALAHPALHWLGVVSYSVYLLHRPVDEVARKPLEQALILLHSPHAYSVAGLPTLAITLLLAAAAYHGIEKPARDWVRRSLSDGHVPPLATEPAAP